MQLIKSRGGQLTDRIQKLKDKDRQLHKTFMRAIQPGDYLLEDYAHVQPRLLHVERLSETFQGVFWVEEVTRGDGFYSDSTSYSVVHMETPNSTIGETTLKRVTGPRLADALANIGVPYTEEEQEAWLDEAALPRDKSSQATHTTDGKGGTGIPVSPEWQPGRTQRSIRTDELIDPNSEIDSGADWSDDDSYRGSHASDSLKAEESEEEEEEEEEEVEHVDDDFKPEHLVKRKGEPSFQVTASAISAKLPT